MPTFSAAQHVLVTSVEASTCSAVGTSFKKGWADMMSIGHNIMAVLGWGWLRGRTLCNVYTPAFILSSPGAVSDARKRNLSGAMPWPEAAIKHVCGRGAIFGQGGQPKTKVAGNSPDSRVNHMSSRRARGTMRTLRTRAQASCPIHCTRGQRAPPTHFPRGGGAPTSLPPPACVPRAHSTAYPPP